MSTIVRQDYAMRSRRLDMLSEYKKNLIIEAGNGLIERLYQVNRLNPNSAYGDFMEPMIVRAVRAPA